jgi:hypothetical protein
MIRRVGLLQGTESTEVFHGTDVSCVSDLTLGKNVRTRLREDTRAHQTHEMDSCVPAMLPPAYVCAAKLRQDRQSAGQALTHAPAVSALVMQHIGRRETF